MSNKLLKKRYNGHCLYRVIPDPRYLTLLTNGYGTLLADALSGYNRDVVHLTATPNEDCHFIDYDSTACEIVGDDLTFGNSDCTAQANFDRNVHNVTTLTSNYGSISVNKNTGYSGDTFTLSNTPNTDCSFGSYSVTGATLTSNQFMMQKQDVSAQGSFSRNVHNVTLQNDGHGRIVANKTTGYSGDTITLSNTANAAYDFSGYTVTGATLTSNQFNIGTENVTAKAWFKKHVYSLTLQNDGHGTLAASKTTGYAGDTVTLTPTNNTYYRFNNYQCTGGSIVGNTFTFGSQNATAKANFNKNTVTASGTWVFSNDNNRRNNAYFIGWPKINASNNTSAISALRYASASQAGTSETTISRTLVTSFSIPTGYSSMSFTSQTWPLALTGGGVSDYTWYLTATLLQSGDGNHQISTKEISVQNARTILFLPNANGNYKGSYYITGHRQTTYGMYENQNAKWGLTAIAP